MPVTFIKAAGDGPVQRAASRMEPRLRAAFLNAVSAMRGTISEDALAKALATGDVDQVLAVLALDTRLVKFLNDGTDKVESLRAALQATAMEGAAAAIRALPSSVSLNLSFDLKSLEAQSFLESYAFPLIRQLTDNTREGIRQVILDTFKNGGHPYEQARTIKTFIGLTQNQSAAVANYRAALSSASTLGQSLNRSLRDGRFDGTVQRAVRNNTGLSADQIDRMTTRYSERYLKYRAEAIARTESIRASNMGQRATWKQAVKQGLLPKDQEREWEVSGDDITCPECLALDGVRVGLNEEFAPGIMAPPDPHTTCRCSEKLVFARAA